MRMSTDIQAGSLSRRRVLTRELAIQANPFVFVPALWRHRYLIRQLTWREVTGRYRSSVLGVAWSLATPMVQLTLYTFLFGVVFKARWQGSTRGDLSEFGLLIFAGMTAFGLFSECVNRAPGLITASPNYVKKVVFPLEVLPVSVLGSALFHTGISVALLLAAHLLLAGAISLNALWLPLMLAPLAVLALGLSWILASFGVFLRDIGHTTSLVTQVLFFATPVFYPREALPESLRPIVDFNPLSPMVDNVRRVSVQGLGPDWPGFAFALAAGLLVLCLGHAWFAKTKHAFADVI
jgi:lipopolysaccharide transport system permease protein